MMKLTVGAIRMSGVRHHQARSMSSQFRERYGCFINGKEVFPDSAQYFKVYAPATGKVICEVASADQKSLNEAVEVGDKVFRSGVWSRSDVRYRANVLSAISVELKAAIPELLELEVAQTGRAVREMKAQVYINICCCANVSICV